MSDREDLLEREMENLDERVDCTRCRKLGDMLVQVNKTSLDAAGLMWEEVDKVTKLRKALEAIYGQARGTPSFDRLAEIAAIAKDALSAHQGTSVPKQETDT